MERPTNSALAPSKSTVYVSNLPFTLTNNDLHMIFEKHGKIVKITILKDEKRRSRGVAFVQFLKIEDATTCAAACHNVEMFGRTLKASLAKDNGRSTEFIKKRKYADKQRCYECGAVDGHLSYKCPVNVLGGREPPPKKVRQPKQNKEDDEKAFSYWADDDPNDVGDAGCSSLSEANANASQTIMPANKPRFKKSAYLSDEEELTD